MLNLHRKKSMYRHHLHVIDMLVIEFVFLNVSFLSSLLSKCKPVYIDFLYFYTFLVVLVKIHLVELLQQERLVLLFQDEARCFYLLFEAKGELRGFAVRG